MKKTWWKESVVYQIYPRSFKDATGNGLGDIWGIIEKLDYVKSLGIDVIWLCPVYQSPNDDNGYDISDYRKISNDFGGQEAFEALLNGVHQREMKLVMDLVANHTSDEHYWFEEAKKSKDNPYRDYYIWREGEKGNPPNNWESFFSGSAWEYEEETASYYLHYFTKKQPDLNWDNPKVRQEIYDIIDFWFQKGVDGFRMDVISLISKPEGLPDSPYSRFQDTIINLYANGPKIHEYLREMNTEVLSKYDIMTVGEGPGIDLKNGPNYVSEHSPELNMVFHFDHMFIDCGEGGKYDPVEFTLPQFKAVFSQWDMALKNKGWGSIFLGNHDFSRMVSKFGNDTTFKEASAKLLLTLLLTLRGTVYLYQGDEIGMTNVAFPSIEDYNDVETLNAYREAIDKGQDMDRLMSIVHQQSRDNARTPMQWDGDLYAGFSTVEPWLGVNSNYHEINVEAQEEDDASVLNYTRQMVAFRKAHKTLVYGEYEDLLPDHDSLYVYKRWDNEAEFLIALNFSERNQTFHHDLVKSLSLQFTNTFSETVENELAPWQAKVFKRS